MKFAPSLRSPLVNQLVDGILAIIIVPGALLMKLTRRFGIQRLPRTKRTLDRLGVFPIRDHYFEPLFASRHIKTDLTLERELPGVNLNEQAQVSLLRELRYGAELLALPLERKAPDTFFFNNGAYEAGDAEILYSVIRHFKPGQMIEVGSGMSTLIARHAIAANQTDNASYHCNHVCIEPYEEPWLESLGIPIHRRLVEDMPPADFEALGANDILFIDSSHVIRTQGDVLFEVLRILPALKPGVIVHVHDIFTPRDYPQSWIVEQVRLWNEQYLIEAFLTQNDHFEVLLALNFLSHHHPDELAAACPIYGQQRQRAEPGSFWIRRK